MPVSAMRLAVGNDVLSSRLWQAGLKLWIEEDKSEYRSFTSYGRH
jgi:hypothetical protein